MIYDARILKYLRVSLEDENDDESNSISHQRELLNAYIDDNFSGKKLLVEEIVDDGYSGTNFRRPGITKALNAIAAGKYDCIIVKDFSRFGRDHIQVGNYLEHIFPGMNVRFISVNDNYDSKNMLGRTAGIDVVIKNLVYEMYSKDLAQKVRSAKEIMMKNGKYAPNSAFYGYVRDGKYGIKVDEGAATVVRQIFQRADEGARIATIAQELNDAGIPIPSVYKTQNGLCGKKASRSIKEVWTNHKIRRILADERYTGKMILGQHRRTKACDGNSARVMPKEKWFVTKNNHEPIISQELYDRVQSKIEHKKSFAGTGVTCKRACFFRCGGCGYTMQRSRSKEKRLVCSMRHSHISDECIDEWITKKELDDVVSTVLKKQFEVMFDNARFYKRICEKSNEKSAETIANEIAVLKRKRFDLYESYKNKNISREVLDEKRNKIASQIEQLENKQNQVVEKIPEETKHAADIVLNYGKTEEFNDDFIKYFVKDVIVFREKRIEIKWNFGLDALLRKEEMICVK